MTVIPIQSIDDPRLEVFRQIKIVRPDVRRDLFVVEGMLLVERLIRSAYPVTAVLAVDRMVQRVNRLLPDDVPLYVIPNSRLSQLVGFRFHRGVLACGGRQDAPTLDDVASPTIDPLTVVVCPQVQDPENLGSILRVSAAFGVNAVIAGPNCHDPFSRRVLRVSMGAAFTVPTVLSDDLLRDLKKLRTRMGVQLVASVLSRDAEPFDEIPRPRRFALLLGREDQGLERQWIELSDRQITIPMNPGVDSLNVAVAAGILLCHLNGQRLSTE